jgi:uncharacterized membrane protein
MSTEHPANYLTIFNGDGDAVQATLDQVLETMKEQLGGENPATLTISNGSIIPASGACALNAESGSSDDLSNIDTTNLMEGQLLLLWPADESTSITVKHQAGGAGQITLRNSTDLVLNATDKYVLLQRLVDDWEEAGHLGNIADPADMKRLEAVREGVTLSRENDVLDLNKGAVEVHQEAGGSDHTVSGTIVTMTAAADLVGTLVFGDICYVDSTGKLKKADADTVATTTSVVMAMETMAADASGSVLLRGFVRDDSWSWTTGGVVYASDTAGGLTQTPGSGAVLGIATSATRMHFTPDKTLTTRQLWMDEDAGGADLTASGAITSLTAGANLSFGDLCYVDSTGMKKVDASEADTNPVEAMALATITSGQSGTFLVRGFVRDDSWSWTKGGVVYATGTTGGMTQSDASGPVVGVATASNLMHFTPDKTLSTRQVRLNEDAGGADLTASGTVVTLTAGEALGFGDVCYLDSVSGKYKKADVDDVATFPGIVMALETINADASGMFLLRGFVRDDSWSWTTGAVIYGSATEGGLSQAASSGAVLGVATGSKYIHFTPDKAVVSQQLAMELNEEADGDHTASGITVDMTAAENKDEDDQDVNLVFGDVCYVGSDGKLWKATAHIATDTPVRAMALATISKNTKGKVLLTGFVRDDTWDWTVGGLVYLSADTGQLTQTKPTGTGEMIQAVGVATHADRIFFDPNSCFTRNDGELRGVFFYPYEVSNSCMFEGSDSTYLSYTPATGGTQTKGTISFWIKRASLDGTVQKLFDAGQDDLRIDANENLVATVWDETTSRYNQLTTSMKLRDPGQWLHVVMQWNTTLPSAADMVTMWVNGVEPDYSSTSYGLNQGDSLELFKNVAHTISQSGGNGFDGYIAEFCMCEDTAYTASDFGVDTNGIWTPKDVSGLTFGTRGCYLDFADANDLGDDESGNFNDWTESVLAAANQSTDTPTNNFCTLNPLTEQSAFTYSDGNLKLLKTSVPTHDIETATFMINPEIGYWYWEAKWVNKTGSDHFGILGADVTDMDTYLYSGDGYSYNYSGTKGNQNSVSAYGATFTDGDILSCAVGDGKIWFAKNGVWQNSGVPAITGGSGEAYSGITGNYVPAMSGDTNLCEVEFNFGGTNIFTIASGNADDNGYGNFEYAPPTGFMALCSANLQDGAGTDPVVGEAIGNEGFYLESFSHNGTTHAITLPWDTDTDDTMVMVKNVDGAAEKWWVADTVRGNGKYISIDASTAETSSANSISFSGSTVTLGSDFSAKTYILSAFRSGAAYGFDIVTYSGTGVAQNVSHSLGATPQVMLTKSLGANNWGIYHHAAKASATPEQYTANPDLTSAFSAASTYWDDTAPTPTLFRVGTASVPNHSGNTMIAYLWTGIEGFSCFSGYEGNNNADGPFVNCGFRPAFGVIKNSDAATQWVVTTTEPNGANNPLGESAPPTDCLYFTTGILTGGFDMDYVSNGIKLRISGAGDAYTNAASNDYIVMAWAAQPFKYANAR